MNSTPETSAPKHRGRNIVLLLITVIVAAIGLLILYQQGIPQDWGREEISRFLSQELKTKVSIEHFSFKFPGEIILHQLKIYLQDKPVITCERVVLDYRLMDWVAKRKGIKDSITQITIFKPWLYLHRSIDGHWNLAHFQELMHKEKKPLSIPIKLKQGRLLMVDDRLKIKDSLSQVGLFYKRPSFYLVGSLNSKQKSFQLSGVIHQTYPLELDYKLRLDERDISNYSSILRTSYGQLLQGSLQADLKGKLIEAEKQLRLRVDSGRLSIAEGQVKLTGLPSRITALSGNLCFSKSDQGQGYHSLPVIDWDSLSTQDLRFNYQGIKFQARASIDDPGHKDVQVELQAHRFAPKKLSQLFGQSSFLSQLNLTSNLRAKGTLSLPSSTTVEEPQPLSLCGQIDLVSYARGDSFPLTAQIRYQDSVLDIQSVQIDRQTILQGKVVFSGQDRPWIKDMQLTAKLNQAKLLPLLCLTNISAQTNGLVNGEVTINGSPGKMSYAGQLSIKGMGKEKPFQGLSMSFKGSSKDLSVDTSIVQTDGGQVKMSLSKGIDLLKLKAEASRFLLASHLVSTQVDLNAATKDRGWDGQIITSQTMIDNCPYQSWQSGFSYQGQRLNLFTPQGQLLSLVGQVCLNPMMLDLVIETKESKLLQLLDKNLVISGRFYVKGSPFKEMRVAADPFKLILPEQQGLEGRLCITRKTRQISLDYLYLNQGSLAALSLSGCLKKGRLNLDGDVKGIKLQQIALSGRVNLSASTSKGQIKGVLHLDQGKANLIPFERARLCFNYLPTKELLIERLELLSNHGQLIASGRVDLKENQRLDGQFSLTKADYQIMPIATNYFKSWQGKFNLQGSIEGELDKPIVKASLTSTGITIKDYAVAVIEGQISYQSGQIEIEQTLNHSLRIAGCVYPQAVVVMELKDVDASLVSTLLRLPYTYVEGKVKGQVGISGDWDNPVVSGELSLTRLNYSGIEAERAEINFTTLNHLFEIKRGYLEQTEGRLEIRRCWFQLDSLEGEADIEVLTKDFSLCGLKTNGQVSFHGQGSPLTRLNGRLTTKNLLLNQSDIMTNLCTQIDYEPNQLSFTPLSSENSLAGQVNLSPARELTINQLQLFQNQRLIASVNGQVNLKNQKVDIRFVMENSDLRIIPVCFSQVNKAEGGNIKGQIHLSGSLDNPDFNGELRVEGGKLSAYPFSEKLTQLKGEIKIVDNWFVTEDLIEARIGKSRVFIKSNGPFSLKKLDLTLKNEDKPVAVNLPGFINGLINIEVRVTGSIAEPQGLGWIELVKTNFTYPTQRISLEGSGLINQINWQSLDIIVGKDVTYYNDYVKLKLKRKVSFISLCGRGEEIKLAGQVIACRGGELTYLGQKFSLRYASLEFKDKPYLTAMAQAMLGSRRILLSYEGYIGQASPILRAWGGYPPLSEQEITMLLLGSSDILSSTEIHSVLRVAMEEVLGQGVSTSFLSPLERSLSQILSLDLSLETLFIEHIMSRWDKTDEETDLLSESKIKVGKFLSDNLYISWQGIIKSVVDEEFSRTNLRLREELELEYLLSNSTSLKYRYIPKTAWSKNEYEAILEQEVRF